MQDTFKKLHSINWDFPDYNSIRYPYDLNSIPWYPATFVPPIPKFLIASLTEPNDIVFDPFGGSGTTVVEALKQNRIPIYNDLNPFATDTVTSIICAIKHKLKNKHSIDKQLELQKIKNICLTNEEAATIINESYINLDVYDWYHIDTLLELLKIFKLIEDEYSINNCNDTKSIRKLAFISILKSASSQPGHFTYVTDNCKPVKKIYKNAINLYIEKMEQICLAAEDFIIQFHLANPDADLKALVDNAKINTGDARKLDWIDNHSVDLVLTSPPYLCAQDYIKTMRLANLFFPNTEAFTNTIKAEIGSRSRRSGKSDIVVPSFYKDLKVVFESIQRILKPGGFFCLIMGQGKSKITSEYNIIADLCDILQDECGFEKKFHQSRNIGNRVIRIGGVSSEDIIIFRKKEV